MYTLEIETKNKIKKINNPRKARLKDYIFTDAIQVMDDNGKWHTVYYGFAEPGWKLDKAISNINAAIKNHNSSVQVEL